MPEQPNLFAAIGYVGEVSEPNGPPVKGFFLDRWGQEAQKDFQRYVAKHDQTLLGNIARQVWIEEQKLQRQIEASPADAHLSGAMRGLQIARTIIERRVDVR